MEISIFIFFVIGILEAVLANMSKIEVKIVGGQRAPIKDFPHSAFLLIECTMHAHVCGASILNQAFLLTAAHCFNSCKKKRSPIYAFLGKSKKMTGLKIAVKKFKKHPLYGPRKGRNDVAIAMLKIPIKLGNTMSRVAIMENPPRDKVAYVAGWGRTDQENNIQAMYLKYAKQVLWDTQECSRILRRHLDQNLICTGVDRNDYGHPASGDSGSALIIRGYIQIGIVAFKVRNITQDLEVYSDTSKHLKWIREETNILNCDTN